MHCKDLGKELEQKILKDAGLKQSSKYLIGETVTETLEMVREALGLCLEVIISENKEVPEPSTPEQIQLENEQFIAIVEFDWIEYQKKYSSKAVKKLLQYQCTLMNLPRKST